MCIHNNIYIYMVCKYNPPDARNLYLSHLPMAISGEGQNPGQVRTDPVDNPEMETVVVSGNECACDIAEVRECSAAQVRECSAAEVRECSAAEVRECSAAQERRCSAAQEGECLAAQEGECSAAQERECSADSAQRMESSLGLPGVVQ